MENGDKKIPMSQKYLRIKNLQFHAHSRPLCIKIGAAAWPFSVNNTYITSTTQANKLQIKLQELIVSFPYRCEQQSNCWYRTWFCRLWGSMAFFCKCRVFLTVSTVVEGTRLCCTIYNRYSLACRILRLHLLSVNWCK